VETAPEADLARSFLAWTLLARGEPAAALQLIDGRNLKVPGCFGHAGRAHALLGNIAEACAEIARLEGLALQGFGVAYDLALIHVALKEPDAAITALERAVSGRSQMMGYMNVDPGLEPVLADARVREISRRIGFD